MADVTDGVYSTAVARKTILFLFLALFALYFIHELKALLICVIFAITLASAMAPVAEWGDKRKIPRALSVLAMYGAIVLIYVLLGALLIPTLRTEGRQLYERLPAYVHKASKWIEKQGVVLPFDPESIGGVNGSIENQDESRKDSDGAPPAASPAAEPDESESQAGSAGTPISPTATALKIAKSIPVKNEDLKTLLSSTLDRSLKMTAGIMGLIANTVLTLFLAAYFVVEADSIWDGLLKWVPKERRERVASLIRPIEARLGGFVRGQLLVSICVAAFLSIGFSMLGLHYALLLGLIAGLLNLIPYLGSFIATASALVVALSQDGGGPVLAAMVFGVYALEQWVESTFIVPHLLGRSVDLHPLVVLLSILIGGTLLGIAGALIAIPLVSVAMVLSEELYLKPMEQNESPPGESQPA